MNMTNAEKYIDSYKELEAIVRSTFRISKSDSIAYYLNNVHSETFMSKEIGYCQEVRNLLQHRERISEKYPVEPTDEMMEYIQWVINKLKNRRRCIEIAVRSVNIFSGTVTDNIRPIMNKMRECRFTHTPILDNRKLIGVLSETSIFNYIVDEGIVDIDDKLTVEHLLKYISLERDDEVFCFQPSSKYVDDILHVFKDLFENGKKAGMVFLTRTGSKMEPIEGILTPWDVLGTQSTSSG